MALGLPTVTTWPVGVSAPDLSSTRKATIVSLSWLAAESREPDGVEGDACQGCRD